MSPILWVPRLAATRRLGRALIQFVLVNVEKIVRDDRARPQQTVLVGQHVRIDSCGEQGRCSRAVFRREFPPSSPRPLPLF